MRRLAIGCLLAVWVLVFADGCSDVGDSSAIPAAEASGAGAPADGASPPTVVEDAGGSASLTDAEPADVDGAVVDATLPTQDAEADDAGEVAMDATLADGGSPEDASSADANETDALVDAGRSDEVDAFAPIDADTPVDGAVPVDAGSPLDSSSPPDAGGDSSGPDDADASPVPPALIPCTTPGQSACVLCQYNNGSGGTLPNATQTCTPTEAALVQHDIATGTATSAGPDPDGSCYQCAALSGCLDDSMFGDVGHECEDVPGPTAPATCVTTISCILDSACGGAAISACYCGTAPVSGTCAAVGASNGANGVCAVQESAGLGFAANDGLDILKNFTSTTLPSGVANNIFQCAASNGCAACLQ